MRAPHPERTHRVLSAILEVLRLPWQLSLHQPLLPKPVPDLLCSAWVPAHRWLTQPPSMPPGEAQPPGWFVPTHVHACCPGSELTLPQQWHVPGPLRSPLTPGSHSLPPRRSSKAFVPLHSQQICSCRPVPTDLSQQTCPCRLLPADLSQLTSPCRPVPADLSLQTSPCRPIPADLSQLTCPCRPVSADLSLPTCPS